ncbi:MAG: hypothetical protein AAB668_00190 [Patescibacteria group bacterium]
MRHLEKRDIVRLTVAVIWILFYPIAWFVLPTFLSSFVRPENIFGAAFLYGYSLYLILVLLEVTVFHIFVKQNKAKDLFWVFPVGLFIQIVCFSGPFFFVSKSVGEALLMFSFGFTLLASLQIPVALLFLFFFFLLRKTKRLWLVSGLTIVVFVGGAIALNQYRQAKQVEIRSKKNDYDAAATRYRTGVKEQTALGRQPRPLRIFFRNGSWLALDIAGNSVAFDLPSQIQPDISFGTYFDVYTDRIYFVQSKQGYMYDLANGTQTSFRGDLARVAVDGSSFIAGAYDQYLALQTRGGDAGTGDVAIYDIQTGSLVSRAVYAGYDDSRTYKFWIGTLGYRLILDTNASKDGSYVVGSGDRMDFYLDEINESYQPLGSSFESSDTLFNDLGKIPFSHSAESLNGRIPMLSVSAGTSKRNPVDNQSGYFSLRSVYQIGMQQIAVEMNDGLAVIDLTNKTSYYTQNAAEIERLMVGAKLLVTDMDDYSVFACAYTDQIYNLLFKETEPWYFAFCLL